MTDEAGLREYIAEAVGWKDSDILSEAAWRASADSELGGGHREIAYLTQLAQVARCIAEQGAEVVTKTLEDARKQDANDPLLQLAAHSKKVVNAIYEKLRLVPPKKLSRVTSRCWKTLLQEMKKKLSSLYPDASDEVLTRAVNHGCEWDRSKQTFGIDPRKLVDAMSSTFVF